MPRRGKKNTSKKNKKTETFTVKGLIPPASTVQLKLSDLKKNWYSCGVILHSVHLEGCAYDSATANKATAQPTFVQVRILDPNVLVGGNDGEENTLFTSKIMLFGPNPKSHQFRFSSVMYPAVFIKGLVAIDVLCPQDGWEGGLAYLATLTCTVGNLPREEKCAGFVIGH